MVHVPFDPGKSWGLSRSTALCMQHTNSKWCFPSNPLHRHAKGSASSNTVLHWITESHCQQKKQNFANLWVIWLWHMIPMTLTLFSCTQHVKNLFNPLQGHGFPLISGAVAHRHSLIYYHTIGINSLVEPQDQGTQTNSKNFLLNPKWVFRQETLSICIPSKMVDPGWKGTQVRLGLHLPMRSCRRSCIPAYPCCFCTKSNLWLLVL